MQPSHPLPPFVLLLGKLVQAGDTKMKEEEDKNQKVKQTPHGDASQRVDNAWTTCMDNLHSKLPKLDRQAVLQLFAVEYNKYFNGLDSSVREACDEQMSQRIRRSWISNKTMWQRWNNMWQREGQV